MATAERWIARHEALARLGVKTQTLYAYVSRGRIAARPDPEDSRRSLYAADDVARLSGEAPLERSNILPFEPAPNRGEAAVQSNQTIIGAGRLFYRGKDAATLAETATVEDTARLLWACDEGDNPFARQKPRVDAVTGISPRGRLFAALSRRADEDAPASGRDPEVLKDEAAGVLNEVVDAVAGPGPRLFFHQRLARGWMAPERDGDLLRRCLVLAADRDMDEAILAARVAAGGGASPAAAAMAGLATLAGVPVVRDLRGMAAYVLEARRDPAGAAARAMAAWGAVPGFGPPAWPQGDPRVCALLAAVRPPDDLAAVLREGAAASGHAPGFPLALTIAAQRLRLPREGAADLLMLGRLVGLLGHALDQSTDGSPVRARLRYVGPQPVLD